MNSSRHRDWPNINGIAVCNLRHPHQSNVIASRTFVCGLRFGRVECNKLVWFFQTKKINRENKRLLDQLRAAVDTKWWPLVCRTLHRGSVTVFGMRMSCLTIIRWMNCWDSWSILNTWDQHSPHNANDEAHDRWIGARWVAQFVIGIVTFTHSPAIHSSKKKNKLIRSNRFDGLPFRFIWSIDVCFFQYFNSFRMDLCSVCIIIISLIADNHSIVAQVFAINMSEHPSDSNDFVRVLFTQNK